MMNNATINKDMFGQPLCQFCALDEIKNLDFLYFSKNKNIFNQEFDFIIQEYYKKMDSKPFYHLDSFFNSRTQCADYRFLIVQTKVNTFFYPYKIVNIIKTKQIRFFDIPISLEKDDLNETTSIIEYLKGLDFIRFIFKESFVDYFSQYDYKRIESYDEFYYKLNGEVVFLSNRWKRKHYINMILSSPDVKIVFSSQIADIKGTFDLRKRWSSGMYLKNDKVRPSTERAFTRFVSKHFQGNKVKVISIYYNGNLIAQEFFLVDLVHRRCESLYCNHVFEKSDDLSLKHIVNKMVAIQKYVSWVHLKDMVDIVYIGTGANKKLYEHKMRTTDGFVKYYIV